jgi:curli biogenesis system outer membrane secretion channel CsgG
MKPMLAVSAAVLLAVISAMPAVAATTSTTTKLAPAASAMTSAAAVTKPVAAKVVAKTTMDSAAVSAGTKTSALKVANLLKLVGKYTKGDLRALNTAKTVWTYDTKTIYTPADQTKLTAAATTDKSKIDVFHTAINNDAGLKAWFDKHSIDVNSVVAVQVGKKGVAVYTM